MHVLLSTYNWRERGSRGSLTFLLFSFRLQTSCPEERALADQYLFNSVVGYPPVLGYPRVIVREEEGKNRSSRCSGTD